MRTLTAAPHLAPDGTPRAGAAAGHITLGIQSGPVTLAGGVQMATTRERVWPRP